MLSDRISAAIIGAFVTLGLVGGAFVLGKSLQETRKADRYVTVRGLAERDVKSDLAIWPLKVRVAGNDLGQVSHTLEENRRKVTAFLLQNGFGPDEVVVQDLRVVDRQASEYGQANVDQMLRYIVESTVLLRSTKIDSVWRVSQMVDELVRAGVVLSAENAWEGISPRYFFTQLNAVKPEMMAEATRNARTAAAQFAADSGSRVGAIRRASQGLFTISDRDRAAEQEAGGGGPGASDIWKRVRVVVTVDYLLDS